MEFSSSPQLACQYLGTLRNGNVIPTRVAWLHADGAAGGIYYQGFERTGPSIPNSENDYQNVENVFIFCVISEAYTRQIWWQPDAVALSLTGATDTRPAGTGGTSTITFTAKATTPNGQPKAGVALNFSAEAKAYSGGHEHHDATREKGTVTPTQGVTNAAGELVVKFSAPKAAGTHTIKATCPSCSNKEVSKEIQVKVPGLIELGADTAKPAKFVLVGATTKHSSNHWFMPTSTVSLGRIVEVMYKSGWGTVGVNDGSLVWGGLFDVAGDWQEEPNGHKEHRVGTEVDVSFFRPNPMSEEQKKRTYSELCKKDGATLDVQTLWHKDDGSRYPHFHVYLDGSGLTKSAGDGPCCALYKTIRPVVKNGVPVLGAGGKPVMETVKLCEETSPR